MCICPAHQSLVDCNGCVCDHTGDRMIQLGEKVQQLQAQLVEAQQAFQFNAEHRWRWLESTVDLQADAFGQTFPIEDDDARADWLMMNATALTTELGEALQETGWKPWSSPRGWINRDAFLSECVDIGHFLANLLVAAGITDDEWEAAYQKKQQVNRDRQAAGYDTRAEKCPACGRAYDDAATDCTPTFEDKGLGTVPYCEDYGVLDTTTTA